MRHLQRLFDLSQDLLCVAGTDGYFRLVNPAFQRTLGYTEIELKSLPFTELVHPDDRAATLTEVQKLGAGQVTLHFENRYRRKDGGYTWLAWTSVPNLEEGLLYAVGRDVTDAKRSLSHLLDDLPGLVYRCRNDSEWTMEYVSEGCRELTGYGADDLRDNRLVSYGSLICPGDRQRVWEEVQRAVANKREFQVEYGIRTAQGRERTVTERGRAIYANGQMTALQGFITDMTETHRLRNELNQLQKMDSLGQLAGGIAHDFNNLLTVVLGNLQLLAARMEDLPEDRELVTDAIDAAWRGAALSQRLLAFSRRQMLSPQVIDANKLIRGMEEMLRRTLGGAVDVSVHLTEDLPPVLIDGGQLENAILNLAINARDAMPEGGTLMLQTELFVADAEYVKMHPDVRRGDYATIEVSDTGTGMSPEVRERVFEPFFTTKETGKGTGLGLSMVYGLLKQSGGHARIYSELGRGTTVRLFVPVAQGHGSTEETGLHSSLETIAGGNEEILVVDDDRSVRKTVVMMLSDLGYRIIEAESGLEALRVIQNGGSAPDLLFTDVIMPGSVNGIDLIEKARSLRPGIKVLLTSGFSERHARMPAQYPLLRKPYRKKQLARAVREALET